MELNVRVQVNETNLRRTTNIVESLVARGDQGKQWIEKKFQVATNGETKFQVSEFTDLNNPPPPKKG